MSEPLMRLLAELPPAEPDPARAERIRMRCRARLARPCPPKPWRRRNASHASAARAAIPRNRSVQLWQPLVAALGIAYMAVVILQALRVYGLP